VFIVFSIRALIRQWEVMTLSFCWSYWRDGKDSPTDTGRALVSDQTKLDMYFATAFQFYAMWEFGELCGHFMSDHRLKWTEEEEGNASAGTGPNAALLSPSSVGASNERPEQIMREYRKTIKWASVLAMFAFVGIGFLKSIVEFALTVALNMLPKDWSPEVREWISLVDKKVNAVFSFATILCVINMLLISKMRPLREALGNNISAKFHGTRTMLLVAQVQPQVLNFFTKRPGHEHKWTVLQPEEKELLNVTLVLYWCLSVSVANAIIWKLDFEVVGSINRRARAIDKSLGNSDGNKALP